MHLFSSTHTHTHTHTHIPHTLTVTLSHYAVLVYTGMRGMKRHFSQANRTYTHTHL